MAAARLGPNRKIEMGVRPRQQRRRGYRSEKQRPGRRQAGCPAPSQLASQAKDETAMNQNKVRIVDGQMNVRQIVYAGGLSQQGQCQVRQIMIGPLRNHSAATAQDTRRTPALQFIRHGIEIQMIRTQYILNLIRCFPCFESPLVASRRAEGARPGER